MKKNILLAMVAASLSACGGYAKAQTIDGSFKDQSGNPSNVAEATFVKRSGSNLLISQGGVVTNVADQNATLYNKLQADTWFRDNFVFAGSYTWFRNSAISQARCVGGRTIIQLIDSATTQYISDNCSSYYQLSGRSK